MKQISDKLSIAGQVSPQELQQAATEGFKSVINLRSPQEDGFIDEQQHAESVGLEYINIPVKPNDINDRLAGEILDKIDNLPKPALIHCASGARAGYMAFMHLATRQNLTLEQTMAKAEELGFDCGANLTLKQFFTDYITQHCG